MTEPASPLCPNGAPFASNVRDFVSKTRWQGCRILQAARMLQAGAHGVRALYGAHGVRPDAVSVELEYQVGLSRLA
jgi:hypothetical protein